MFPREIFDLIVEAVDPSTEDFCSLLFVSHMFWMSARAILFRHTVLKFHICRRPNRSVTLLRRVIQGDPSVLQLIKSLEIPLDTDSQYETISRPLVNDENFGPLVLALRSSPIHTLRICSLHSSWFSFEYIQPSDLDALIALRSIPSLRKLFLSDLHNTPARLVGGVNRDDLVDQFVSKSVKFVDNILFYPAPVVPQVPQDFKLTFPIFQNLTQLVLDRSDHGALEALFPLLTAKDSRLPTLELPSLISLTLGASLRGWVEEDVLQPIISISSKLIPIAPSLQTLHLVQHVLSYPTSWRESALFEGTTGFNRLSDLRFSWNITSAADAQAIFNSMASVAAECLALRRLKSLIFIFHSFDVNTYRRTGTEAVSLFVNDTMFRLKDSLRQHTTLRHFGLEIQLRFEQGYHAREPEARKAIDSLRVALEDFTIRHDISFEHRFDIVPYSY